MSALRAHGRFDGGQTSEAFDREEQYRIKREAVLRTAARAFNESNYYTTSLDQLAARLGVTKPTLYHYVRSKDDILFECQRLALDFMREALADAEEASRPGLERLRAFLRRHADLVTSDFGMCLIRTGLKPLPPASRAKLQPLARRLESTVVRIIEDGIHDGSIVPCDPKLAARALFGAFNGLAYWFRHGRGKTLDEVVDEYLGYFVQGLGRAATASAATAVRRRRKNAVQSR